MNWPYNRPNIRTIPRLVFVTVPSCHVHHVEVAIVVVVLKPSPNLGTANLIAFTFLGSTSERFLYNSYKPCEEPMAYLDPQLQWRTQVESYARFFPQGTAKCLFQRLFAKIHPHAPNLSKLWNVIVGSHDCNCSMHLSKFSAVNAGYQKKRSLLYTLTQFRPPPASISEKKVNTTCLCTTLSTCSPKTNVSCPPLNKFLRTPLSSFMPKYAWYACLV